MPKSTQAGRRTRAPCDWPLARAETVSSLPLMALIVTSSWSAPLPTMIVSVFANRAGFATVMVVSVAIAAAERVVLGRKYPRTPRTARVALPNEFLVANGMLVLLSERVYEERELEVHAVVR